MINKIKDKQTGEYHDIGGLKCKLVAEGALIYNEGGFFDSPYQLENGKYYSIQIWDEDYCRIVFNGFYFNDELYAGVSKDGANDNFIGMSILGSEIYFCNTTADDVNNFYEKNCSLKIYELPFALEV